jgi:hypothetical protein
MNIGDVLSQTWKTIWKHKVLWIFGILAGCGSAGTGAGNGGITYQFNAPNDVQYYIDQIDPALAALYIGLLILVALVIIVLVIFFSTIGRIGLIRGTYQNYNGATRLTFGEIFSGSTPYFWRVFGLNLLVGLLTFVAIVGLLFLGILGVVVTLGIFLLCLIPILCLLMPVIWLLGVYVEQAIIAIVLEDLGVMDGLRRGWQVFKGNFGDMFIMGLILLIISLVVTFVLILPVMAAIFPFLIGIFSGTSQAFRTGVLVAIVTAICYLPIFLVLNGLVRAYIESAWTLNYIRLVPPKADLDVELDEALPSPS